MRTPAFVLCCAFLVASLTPRFLGASKADIPSGDIDREVLAALTQHGAAKPKVIAHIDLTQPFDAVSQWTFVAVQEEQPSSEFDEHGPLHVCLVRGKVPDCSENPYQDRTEPPFSVPYSLLAKSVVYAGQSQSNPLLFVQMCSFQGINGNCGIATILYRYEKRGDRFVHVFQNMTNRNTNDGTRFVEQGPLQGNVIVNYPTQNAPFTYWIEVYRPNESGKYVQVLRYRGHTHYGDGNPLAVADSEMPAILSRLGFWRQGDALPVPPHTPKGCSHLVMQRGEEWCK